MLKTNILQLTAFLYRKTIQKSNSKIVKQNVSLTLQSNDETEVLNKGYVFL